MKGKENKYKAVKRCGPGNMECKTITANKLDKEKVLIKILHAGICGSDIARVKENVNKWDEVVLGHEAVGVIEKISAGLSSDYSLK